MRRLRRRREGQTSACTMASPRGAWRVVPLPHPGACRPAHLMRSLASFLPPVPTPHLLCHEASSTSTACTGVLELCESVAEEAWEEERR